MNFKSLFQNTAQNGHLLASEDMLRFNAAYLSQYCRDILTQRNLPLSLIAYDYFIKLNQGKMRKDGITLSEQHEQLHIIYADALLNSEGNKLGWDKASYGGEDAFFTAIIFHDVIEDHDHTDFNLLEILKDGVTARYEANAPSVISTRQVSALHKEADAAIDIVRILSRNYPGGQENKLNRIEYMNRLLDHPAAVLIKQIDWANKEATMVGVPYFEDNGQDKIKKNLEETDEFFGDERQAIPRHAAKIYPGIAKKVEKLDAVMAVLHHSLKGYVARSRSDYNEDYEGSPRQQYPYDYSRWIPHAKCILQQLPAGTNLICIQQARIEEMGKENPVIRDYHNFILKPAIAPLLTPEKSWSLKPFFQSASSCVTKRLQTLWEGPQRFL